MRFEYGSKSQEYDASGAVSATKVTLVNSDGASVPIFLPPDKIDLSNSELLKLALEVIYQENFPQRAENEKFSELQKQTKTNQEKTKANQAEVEKLNSLTDVLVSVAISVQGGIDRTAYSKVATLIAPLVQDKRYTSGDIVTMPYPFNTNPKWTQGTATIFKFQMQQSEGYTYQNQALSEMLQQGILTIIMPKIE